MFIYNYNNVITMTKTQTFPAGPYKLGNSWVITLPFQYIRDGSFNPEKVITVTIQQEDETLG